ncbi:MAG TPA: ComF family protein, partial [Sphingomonas sp.]
GDGEARCARCIADPPRHAGVRAAVAYGPTSSAIVLRLKYGGRMGLATTCARAMVRLMPPDAELLTPVPLHRWRLWRRGYNQALLLANELRALTGVPVARDALTRRKATPVLRGLGPRGRAKAVAGAFAVPDADQIAHRRVVLIDDVHTTGATLDSCARALLGAGATSVTLLCWARVLADD